MTILFSRQFQLLFPVQITLIRGVGFAMVTNLKDLFSSVKSDVMFESLNLLILFTFNSLNLVLILLQKIF